MSLETYIARQMAIDYVDSKDKTGADSIRALCTFADVIQLHFNKETLLEVLEELKILDA